jgi:hypothetical protein
MDNNEKLTMYRRKADFIKRLDAALTKPAPQGSVLTGIRYELYEVFAQEVSKTFYEEFIILEFEGGGTCAICANGNSDCANLRVVANNINGGNYEDEYFYNRIKEKSKLVTL